ncbi:MAG TPA: hypothetical protein DCY20_01375 [Firmicutes bacterium]|nr:hypothetical protein [Bacillota bacterium]
MNPYYINSPQQGEWNQSDHQAVQKTVFQPCYFRILYLSDANLDIDCYCDGVLFASNLKHSHALNYLQMNPGYHQLSIERNADGKKQVLLRQDILLIPTEYMTLCVVEKNQGIQLYAIIDEVYPIKDKIQKLRIINFTTQQQLQGELAQKIVVKNLNPLEMTPYINVYDNEREVLKITCPMRGDEHLTFEEVDFSKSIIQTIYIIEDRQTNRVSMLKLKDGVL